MIDIVNPYALDLDAPRVGEYFGLWAILEAPFRAAVANVEGIDLAAHLESEAARRARDAASDTAYEVTADGVAIVPLSGSRMKRVDSYNRGTSTVRARQKIRAAVEDDEVVGILLLVESPGGTVAGTADLGDEVARATGKKPVIGYIEDLGASAAYWVPSQATRVYANRTATIGSIGTYAVIYDQSARATLAGIKVHVIRAGAMKGAGTPGTEITAEQLADWQRVVDAHNAHFIDAVAAGRNLPRADVEALADGRVWVGAAAVEAGLVDGIRTLDETLSEFPSKKRSKRKMSETIKGETVAELRTTEPSAATFDELEAALVGASAEFVVGQLKKRATLDEARAAWMAEQSARIEAAEKRADEAEAKADAGGVDPVGTGNLKGEGAAAGGDAAEQFWGAVRERQAAGMPRARAVSAVARERPEIREQMVDEHNRIHRAKRR
jgi:signal peptide peptidase SppA